MRTLLLALMFVAFGGAQRSVADEPQPVKDQPTLKVGDAPPPLKATKWLAGSEVKAFESGKVYVVEFWATWCGPCVVMMPHLGDIQEELAGKVTVIGFTAKDERNTPERVDEFVKKRGAKLGYTIAYADDQETYDSYMKASGRGGIPCSFVIGKDGKIAYIGHPLFLDEVLPKVLAGTWDAAKGTAELEAADKLWDKTFEVMSKPNGDPAEQLAEWEQFSAKWPRLAADPYMTSARLKLLVAAKRFGEAQKLAADMAAKASKRNDIAALGVVADAVTVDAAAGQAALVAVGVKAAESALTIDGETATALIRVIKTHTAAGNTAKVKEFGAKAVTAAEKEVKDDKDAIGTLRVAAAYLAAGDKAKARAAAEKAINMVDAQNAGMKKYVEDQAKKYTGEPKSK